MELEVVSSKYGGSDGTEAEVGEVSATTKSDPAVPTLAAEHSTTIGEVSTAALCSLDSQDESETLVDADVAALEEVGPDITMALDVLPEPMPSKQQEGSRIRDNVSQIADAAAEAIPTAADPEVQCVLFVRRMMKAFRKGGEDQLRLAWKMGAVLKRLRDHRDHGNKKGQVTGLNALLITSGLKANSGVYAKVQKDLKDVGTFLRKRWKDFNMAGTCHRRQVVPA